MIDTLEPVRSIGHFTIINIVEGVYPNNPLNVLNYLSQIVHLLESSRLITIMSLSSNFFFRDFSVREHRSWILFTRLKTHLLIPHLRWIE